MKVRDQMHREFKRRLKDAKGESEFIIAVNIDTRGFSEFSKEVDSQETAMFIKRVYAKLIDNYFPDASFFKPTGDGLLIAIPFEENNLNDVARRTFDSCFKVLKEFSTFCKNDPMINFEVPKKVGIGISRGSACRLISKKKILDYSGKVLNKASRLMDLARPEGIVFDADFGKELLLKKHMDKFRKDKVYLKGIAERKPIEIYHTKKITRISPYNKRPLDEVKWKSQIETLTLKQMKTYPSIFRYYLHSQPLDSNEIKVEISFPGIVRGKRKRDFAKTVCFSKFDYESDAGKPAVDINFRKLAEGLEKEGLKNTWKFDIEIKYPER